MPPRHDRAVAVVDGTGSVVGWDTGAEALLQRPAADALGRRFFDLLVPEGLRDSFRDAFEDHLGGAGPVFWTLPVSAGSGDQVLVELDLVPVETEEVRRTVAVIRRSLSSGLASPLSAMQLLFDRAPEIITLIDRGGRQRSVNDAARRLLGFDPMVSWPENAASDRPPPNYDFVHPEDRPELLRIRSTLGEDVQEISEPIRFRVRDVRGEWRWLESLFINMFDVPGLECRVVFSRDVTEAEEQRQALAEAHRRAEEQAEQLRRYDEARNAFLATISHELRTPLTSLSSATELLLDDQQAPLPEATRSTVEVVLRSTERLRQLVEDLLLVERLEGGMIPVRPVPFDLTELLELSAEVVAAAAPGRAVAITIACDAPELVVGDELRLGQVVENLLGNAVKYTTLGTVVQVEARASSDGFEVHVSDRGPGVEPESRERIFDRFVRGPGADTDGTPGSGLGLSIARAVVELHGGTIGVDDAPGGGAHFWFRIPATGVTGSD